MSTLQNIVRKVVGTQNERFLKSVYPLVARVNDLEPSIQPLTNDQLRAKTAEFRERVGRGETLDQLLPEAFAVVREAAKRTIGQRHYDVQLIGGMTLHKGRIAEMRTGEGKTLVATLPAYLNGLSGKGVHVITVNDYLARRDSEWMGQIHRFLGLEVGLIVHGLTDAQRKKSYAADITYGTNNEFGFDYLRDNMKFRLEDYVQRELNFCIVDEVDSILIDEARTPLIISGPSDESTDLYYKIDGVIRRDGGLVKDKDYTVDEKSKTASLSEAGVDKIESRLGVTNIYDPSNIEVLHHVNQALRAHVLYKRDVEYVVRDGEVLIVDEFTGRLMPGRRWSDGLHQAIEAKEGVDIESENQTLATITFQNYFRMYNKLSGMTGTADTEATEFDQIYKLQVTVIPTHRAISRKDNADVIYKSAEIKYQAICQEIKELHQKGQPVLVGTVSVEKSEVLANLLKREGVPHSVLNAKQHERESQVVAQAGRKGQVTIATNMAGRGTDIVLGGNHEELAKDEVGHPPLEGTDEELKAYQDRYQDAVKRWDERCQSERKEVKELGGLYILGTERHESRRIDNQLRGRSGRQGDPGGSRFYLSLDDDLMRIFGSVNIKRFMEDDLPIEHRWINKAIENAQKKVEGHNYDIRKHLLEYDDVMNEQRKIVYGWRKEVLARPNLREMVFSLVDELAEDIAADFFPNGRLPRVNGSPHLDLKELNDAVRVMFQIPAHITENDIDPFNDKGLRKLLVSLAEQTYGAKERELGEGNMRQVEKMVLLSTIDQLWKDHLLAMDHLREGIGLQGYGQKDPLIEYKKQGFAFFAMMMKQITGDCVRKCFAVQISQEGEESEENADLTRIMRRRAAPQRMTTNLTADGQLAGGSPAAYLPGAQGGPGSAGMGGGPMGGAVPGHNPLAVRGGGMPARNGGMGGGPLARPMQMGARPAGGGPVAAPIAKPVASNEPKVGRNDPCWCGSGKKFKKCHGA